MSGSIRLVIGAGLLVARGLSGFLALMGVFYALMHLPPRTSHRITILASGIHRLAGLYLSVGTPPQLRRSLCVLLSLVGLGCMVSPYWGSTEPAGLSQVALLAGLGARFGQRCCLHTGTEVGRHRASQCDCVVFSSGVYSRHLVIGGQKVSFGQLQKGG